MADGHPERIDTGCCAAVGYHGRPRNVAPGVLHRRLSGGVAETRENHPIEPFGAPEPWISPAMCRPPEAFHGWTDTGDYRMLAGTVVGRAALPRKLNRLGINDVIRAFTNTQASFSRNSPSQP